MATLQSISELSWRQIFPNPSSQTSITKQEFIATARSEWAYQTLLAAWKEKADEGYYNVPSYLISEVTKDIVNNEMDISDLKYFKSLPQDVWLINIGGINCKCKYIKSDVNLTQLLCDDDSMDDAAKSYYITGKKIKFPNGTHKTPLPLTYANMGDDASGTVEVDDALGALIRQRLQELYLGKVPATDVTDNNNPNV